MIFCTNKQHSLLHCNKNIYYNPCHLGQRQNHSMAYLKQSMAQMWFILSWGLCKGSMVMFTMPDNTHNPVPFKPNECESTAWDKRDQEQTGNERTGQGGLEQDRTGRTGQHITAQGNKEQNETRQPGGKQQKRTGTGLKLRGFSSNDTANPIIQVSVCSSSSSSNTSSCPEDTGTHHSI